MKYIAGFNQPGYLPESDPEEFDTFDEALEWLSEILDHNLSQDDTPDELIDDQVERLEDNNEPFAFLATDGYAYWVMEDQ